MVLRAKEIEEWTNNHKTLLEREKTESRIFHDSKKKTKSNTEKNKRIKLTTTKNVVYFVNIL